MVWWTIQRETRIQGKPASFFTQHMRDVTVVPPAGVFIADVEETLHYLQGKYYRDINRKLQINILYPGICFMFMQQVFGQSFELAVNPAFITVVLFEARLSIRDTLGKTKTIKLKMCLVLHHYWVCGYTVFTEAHV